MGNETEYNQYPRYDDREKRITGKIVLQQDGYTKAKRGMASIRQEYMTAVKLHRFFYRHSD